MVMPLEKNNNLHSKMVTLPTCDWGKQGKPFFNISITVSAITIFNM